jgi:hypothetical protein
VLSSFSGNAAICVPANAKANSIVGIAADAGYGFISRRIFGVPSESRNLLSSAAAFWLEVFVSVRDVQCHVLVRITLWGRLLEDAVSRSYLLRWNVPIRRGLNWRHSGSERSNRGRSLKVLRTWSVHRCIVSIGVWDRSKLEGSAVDRAAIRRGGCLARC